MESDSTSQFLRTHHECCVLGTSLELCTGALSSRSDICILRSRLQDYNQAFSYEIQESSLLYCLLYVAFSFHPSLTRVSLIYPTLVTQVRATTINVRSKTRAGPSSHSHLPFTVDPRWVTTRHQDGLHCPRQWSHPVQLVRQLWERTILVRP